VFVCVFIKVLAHIKYTALILLVRSSKLASGITKRLCAALNLKSLCAYLTVFGCHINNLKSITHRHESMKMHVHMHVRVYTYTQTDTHPLTMFVF